MFVYKAEISKDETEVAVVRFFILYLPFMTGWLFKIIRKVLIPDNHPDWLLQLSVLKRAVIDLENGFRELLNLVIINHALDGFLCKVGSQ